MSCHPTVVLCNPSRSKPLQTLPNPSTPRCRVTLPRGRFLARVLVGLTIYLLERFYRAEAGAQRGDMVGTRRLNPPGYPGGTPQVTRDDSILYFSS